jgi:hypothetical protein
VALVRDTRTWAGDKDDVRAYLGLPNPGDPSAYDAQLELWYTQAAEEADVYFDFRPWTDSEGADVTQPTGVKVGCFDWVRAVFEGYKNKAAAGGVTSVKTAQLARTFATPKDGGGLNLVDIGRRAASPSWRPYKVDVIRGGLL